MRGFFWGVHGFFWGECIGYDEIWSMSGRYASYWNAFLLEIQFLVVVFEGTSLFKFSTFGLPDFKHFNIHFCYKLGSDIVWKLIVCII